jgi:DnaK suppressor protein
LAVQRNMLLGELRQVEHALHRALAGTYGLCEDCGQQIPPRRLEVVPAATLCVRCQSRHESRRVAH